MGNHSKQKAAGNKRFNAYIIPIMVIIGLIPLIVHLKQYKTNLDDLAYFVEEEYYDIFLYYKAMFFIVTCIIMLVLTIVQAIIRRETLKFAKLFIPLCGYAFLSFLSAIFSEYGSFSFTGIFEQFESVWVLLGYALTVYYCFIFISSAKDVDLIMTVFTVATVIMLLIGLTQAFSQDIFRTELGRKLLLPTKYWSDSEAKLTFEFPLGRVYLTLYNPNYVGSYVALISPVFLMLAFAKKKVWLAVVNLVIYVGLLLCILGSGSRAGFVGVAFSLLLLVIIFNKKLIRFIPEALIVVVLIIGVAYTYNNWSNDQLFSKIRQALNIEESEFAIKSIETNDNNVIIHYNDNQIKLSCLVDPLSDDVGVNVLDENDEAVFDMNPAEGGGYLFTTDDERFSKIQITFGFLGDFPAFLVNINNKRWDFVYSMNDRTYYYLTNAGKLGKMNNAPYVEALDKYGRAMTSRGFIWSRTLPLLKDNILIGTGPDTFMLAFPNDDYVSMYNYGFTNAYMTKPHNMYLQIAVQTGVLSLICFLAFYFWYFISSVRLYRKSDKSQYLPIVGIGILCGTFGYMVVGIINDSMVVFAPIYWVMVGIGLAINFMIKRDNIFPVVSEVAPKDVGTSKDGASKSETSKDGASKAETSEENESEGENGD